jgi:hypothetical protein
MLGAARLFGAKIRPMLEAVLHASAIRLLEAFLSPPVKLVQGGRVR